MFHVTRYDKDGRVTTAVVSVEAESKTAAAEKVCGFAVVSDVKPGPGMASVLAFGEPARLRKYFRRASEGEG